MKYAAFGASVTQQKTGYCYYIQKLFNINIEVFGYGAQQIWDAGIIYIDKVVEYNPDVLLIDWFSGFHKNTDINICTSNIKASIETILYKLNKIKCKPIFLFLPYLHRNEALMNNCKKMLELYEIDIIDIANYFKFNNLFIRDQVHTTNLGSEFYARLIMNNINLEHNNSKILSIKPNKFVDIKSFVVNKIFKKQMIIEGKCNILGISLKIGPNSGIICINNTHNINLWDLYCYFTRDSIKLCNIFLPGPTTLFEITQIDFDRGLSDKKYDFSNIEYELNIDTIYYNYGNIISVNGN